jgi:serine/threonine protein kinase
MTICNHCDREQLQRLLNEALPDAVESQVADHVADCPTCQQELESLAAVKDWWVEASQRLSKSSVEVESLRLAEIDRNPVRPAVPHSEWTSVEKSPRSPVDSSASSHLHAELFEDIYASDFAVDFLEPSDDATVLGRLGEYEIVGVIGRGGMGIVLKGFQKELHRFVAVKVLSPHLATSGAARRRFAREAQATAAVVNPHVMAIHSVHANSKLPYLVMPYVDCESLQQRLDCHGPLDVKDVLRIGMQAALGLAAAHAQGLVHRDVKPANILLETNVDRVMLTDFGLARAVDDATLTRTGIIAGTPQYMSPEQANGDAIDHRSDLFSLGSVLYAMCTARPPFRAETTFGVLRRIRETDPRPIREINADIPEWLEQIVMKLLSKHATGRLSTATEVATLLEQCLAHVQQPTAVPLPFSAARIDEVPVKPPAKKRKSRSFESAVVTIVAMVIVVWMFWPGAGSKPSEQQLVSEEPGKPIKSTDESGSSREPLDPTFEWNQAQSEINGVDQSLKQIETSVSTDLELEATVSDEERSQRDRSD